MPIDQRWPHKLLAVAIASCFATAVQANPGGGSVVSSTGGNEEDSAAPYRTLVGGLPAYIHPSSVLFTSRKLPQYVVYSELLITSKRYMRGVTSIESVVSWFMAEKLADGNVFQ